LRFLAAAKILASSEVHTRQVLLGFPDLVLMVLGPGISGTLTDI